MKYEQYDNIIKHNSWWLRLEVTSTEQKCNTSRQKLPGTHILELPLTLTAVRI